MSNFCYDVAQTGSLTVIKRVVNDDDGNASSDDWTMNVAGPSASSFPGAADPGTTKLLTRATTPSRSRTARRVTRSRTPVTATQTVNVSVAAGQSKTCILTNDDNEAPPPENGTITVEKQLIPDGYQPPQGGFVFTGAINATLGDGESKTVEVEPGTYSVTESLDGRPFWDLISIECSDGDSSGDLGTLSATYKVAAGEHVTCVFTNQKRSIIIVKKVTNPSGLEGSFDFTASYDEAGFSLSDGEQNVSPEIKAGNYSVSESTPAGWVLESATCDNGDDPSDIDLPASTIVTCTFVNAPAPERGTIIVKKVTAPSGDDTEFGFEFGETDFTLSDGQSEGRSTTSMPGPTRSPRIRPRAGISPRRRAPTRAIPTRSSCAAGETVTCMFTNTKRGTIIVEKQTSPDKAPREASRSPVMPQARSVTAARSSSPTSIPGTYTSTEAESQGWCLTHIACDDADSTGSVGTPDRDVPAGTPVRS